MKVKVPEALLFLTQVQLNGLPVSDHSTLNYMAYFHISSTHRGRFVHGYARGSTTCLVSTQGRNVWARRYRIIRLMGTLAVAYFFVFLTGLMTLMAHVRNATMLNGWFGIDIIVWCFLVFVFLKKLAAPRQGFVGYSEVVTSQGAWEL